MQNFVKIALRKKIIISRSNLGSIINFSLLMYDSIQASPAVGCVIYDRPYRSFYRPSSHLWCPEKVSPETVSCKRCLLSAAVETWTQRTDLPRLGKLGEELEMPSGMGLPMKQRQLRHIETVLEENDSFLGTETVKGNIFSQETVACFADLSIKLKSCRVFCTSVCILRGIFHQIMLFSCYLSSKTFLSSFPVF